MLNKTLTREPKFLTIKGKNLNEMNLMVQLFGLSVMTIFYFYYEVAQKPATFVFLSLS